MNKEGCMTSTIRIDNEVLEKLKEHAEPFVDTPNSVLRRLLGLAARAADVETNGASQPTGSVSTDAPRRRRSSTRTSVSRSRRRRAEVGTTLPDAEYELPILEILSESG